MQYSPSVTYLHHIVQGLAEAMPPHAIRELYNAYAEKIGTKPLPLAKYIKYHLKSAIALKLLDSREAVHFQNLSAKDISYILGNDVTTSAVINISYMITRLFKRREYEKNFDTIREIMYLQQTLNQID